MIDLKHKENQIRYVTNFDDFVTAPMQLETNAICWTRKLEGDFAEIISMVELTENMVEVSQEELLCFNLSEQGNLAREILLNDLSLMKAHGASPILNVIKCYERDDSFPLFPTDVYSFHVDHSPIPNDTFLCTYHGASSELLPNAQAIQKILLPELRDELKKIYQGPEAGFELFLKENFFDLHYQALPGAAPISVGLGNFWRLVNDYPGSQVLPCIHRAPMEESGQYRLLLIC